MVKCLSCPNESYIGETSRVVETKMKQHSNSKDSAVAGHIIHERGHCFNLDNPAILCFESGYILKEKLKRLCLYKSTICLLMNKFYPIHYICF